VQLISTSACSVVTRKNVRKLAKGANFGLVYGPSFEEVYREAILKLVGLLSMDTIEETLARMSLDERDIHNFSGFKAKWREYPIDNCTTTQWILSGPRIYTFTEGIEITPDVIKKGVDLFTVTSIGEHYRAGGYSAFVADTGADGNIFFSIYKDSLRITDPELIALCEEFWG